MELLPSQAHFRKPPRLEVLDNYVRRIDESEQELPPRVTAEIERNRPFIEIVKPEEETAIAMRAVVNERPDPSARVAAGRLDLNHVRPHIGHQAPGQTRPIVGQVQHA